MMDSVFTDDLDRGGELFSTLRTFDPDESDLVQNLRQFV
jgi:hypothetical protein